MEKLKSIKIYLFLALIGLLPLSKSYADNAEPETEAMLECLSISNQAHKYFRSQSPEEKFAFTVQILEQSYGSKAVNDYNVQKAKALKNEDGMNLFFNAIMAEITEKCVSLATTKP